MTYNPLGNWKLICWCDLRKVFRWAGSNEGATERDGRKEPCVASAYPDSTAYSIPLGISPVGEVYQWDLLVHQVGDSLLCGTVSCRAGLLVAISRTIPTLLGPAIPSDVCVMGSFRRVGTLSAELSRWELFKQELKKLPGICTLIFHCSYLRFQAKDKRYDSTI